MNLDQLKIFIAVAEDKSFSKAAQRLYISHSTTSRNVASLEQGLGVSLLRRNKRTVELTPAGEILYQEGIGLLKKVDSIKVAVRNAGDGLSGRISVASVSLYSYILSNGYDSFCKSYPNVVLEMFHMELGDICEHVRMGSADLGVTFSYALPDDSSQFVIMPVACERFCVVAPVEHPLALKRTVNIQDLRDSRFISLPPINSTILESINFFKRVFVGDVSSVPTLESLFLQVRSGNGVSLVPYPIAFEFGGRCAILELEGVDTSFDIDLIWRKDSVNSSLPLLIEILKNQIHHV